MSTPSRRSRLAWSLFAIVAFACIVPGCKQFVLLGYLIGGPPSIAPEFEEHTGESFTDYGVRTVIVVYAPNELKYDFHAIDKQLARVIAQRFVYHHIHVIEPDLVADWMDRNNDWDSPAEIGAQFEADYVVYVDLVKYNLYEENSANLYRGRAEALVSCVKMDEYGDGEEIFKKDILSTYPTRMPRETSEISYEAFKSEYLKRLSEEIGRLFYEHYLSDDIGAAG